MPRQLKEIKNFNIGTILNVSEKDIPDDAAAYSLNVDPLSENGILNAINTDKFFFATNEAVSTVSTPISWGTAAGEHINYNTQGDLNPTHAISIDNVGIFKNKASSHISFIGTKGIKETLIADSIQPWYEKVKAEALYMTFTPSAAITDSDTSFTYLTDTNEITRGTVTSDSVYTISGFTSGTATIKAVHATVSNYDGGTLVVTTPEGKIVTYIFDDDGDGATGTVDSSGRVRIQLQSLSGVANVAAQIKAAIEDPDGHAGLISIATSTTDVTNDTLTLTYVANPIATYLKIGDYLTFTDTTASSGALASTHEIMQITDIDDDNSTIHVERGCFGTPTLAYSTSVIYYVYSNRQTIDGIQLSTNRATCRLGGWSDYSGNNIGGNGSFLTECITDATKRTNGGVVNAASLACSVQAEGKVLTFGLNVTNLPLEEGDFLTIYTNRNGGSNMGFSSKIVKKSTGPLVITLEDNVDFAETNTSDIFYFEGNILKNHTLTHSRNERLVDVGASEEYKINAWRHSGYKEHNDGFISNLISGYINTNIEDGKVALVSSGGYWESSPGNIDLGGVTDRAAIFYPFLGGDCFVRVTSQYLDCFKDTSKATLADENDSVIECDGNASSFISANDILKIGSEYMKVIKVENKQVTVERGHLDSTPAVHSADTDIFKCVNHGIEQTIAKNRMKPGQSYRLSFYAKNGDDAGKGALSIKFNGGYIKSDGTWTKGTNDLTAGYGASIKDIQQEARWIDFADLEKPNNDVGSATTLDNIWRKFSFVFYVPNAEFNTDIELQLAARGVEASTLDLDLFDLSENTIIYNNDESSLFKSSSYIDNAGTKDLVSYDSKGKTLRVIQSIFGSEHGIISVISNFSKSDTSATEIVSSIDNATFVPNNRELHIGFGGKKEDTSPQWLGYVNHKIFGKDYSGELYQDEDTVHTYDDEGTGTMSKVCLAGEHERIAGVVSSTGSIGDSDTILTITHVDHRMNVGDNIIVREWMDSDNSWDGNGIWVVTTRTDDDNFICKRDADFDNQPSAVASNNLISYRPYFYYGIKDGDPSIYRIWPDNRIKADLSADTTYTKGKIEKSLPIAVGATSITTCYNKKADGTGGGRVYILSSTSDEVYSYNVEIKYNEWTTTPLVQISNMDLAFKSFKWSNDHINGNISGTTAVFGSLAAESSPTIKYSGMLSDIIETKGTTETFDADETANSGITCAMFDTRLWVQCRPAGESAFSEGARFLFCAKTEDGNTDGPDVLYCADRSPPTNLVCGQAVRYSTGGHGFSAGPGVRSTGDYDAAHTHLPVYSEIGKYAYFYHYFDDDDHKRKNSRMSVYGKHASSHHGTSGIFNAGGGGANLAYMNYGYNVGWDGVDGMPSIRVAKYGMFQVADNDGDGVLDGTGVVVANDETITDTADRNGPYGTLHQRVCSHAVGLIGAADTQWQRHWGRQHAHMAISGDDYYISNYGDGPYEDAPELMPVDKCIFISTDMHYGDDQPVGKYVCNYSAEYDTDKETTLTVNTSTTTGGVSGLEVGDSVYIAAGPAKTTVVTYVDKGSNTFRVAVPPASFTLGAGTWNVYSHAFLLSLGLGTGGVHDSEIMFHFAYDEDDPNNGDRFTEGAACGHYTKTYFTPPAYWGGPKSSSYITSTISTNPGAVFPIEKLSFRGGVMMRPFTMDDEDFNDLIVGNGVYIDMPSWPNPVYHTANGSKLHDDRANSSPNNSFASKLFITCPISADTEQRSKVYMCDLNFMYPSESLQAEETMTIGSAFTTNSWNSGTSWDVCFTGTVNAYDVTNTSADLEGNNALQPTVDLNIPITEGPNQNIFSSGSVYRDNINALHGLCLSVMDQATGAIQTRYIVGSKRIGAASDDDMKVKIHYPFGHSPIANDRFWVWKHSLVCTAPVRLMKTTTLPYFNVLTGDPTLAGPIYKGTGDIEIANSTAICTTTDFHNLTTNDLIKLTDLSSETVLSNEGVHKVTITGPKTFTSTTITDPGATITGTWTLLDDSDSSNANPLTVSLTRPLISTHFGGLDMRKTKTHPVTVTADDTANIALTSTAHLLTTGDSATFKTELITNEVDRLINGTSSWTEYSPDGTAPTFDADGSSGGEYISITQIADTDPQGAQLATSRLELIQNTQTYRVTAEMWCASSTLAGVTMKIGNVASTITDTINTKPTYYTKDITASSDNPLIIYTAANTAVVWNIDNISVQCISQEGTYIGTDAAADTIDIVNADFSADTNGTLYTNQWEMLIAGTSARSEMGELRAGFTQWDKGNIAANVQRYDSTADTDRFINYGESSVKIVPTSLADQDGDFFLKNNRYYYKISFIYDGYQEGPLSDSYWSHYDTSTRNKLSISITVKNYSRRLSHVCIYRKDTQNDFYKLVKEISTESGWNQVEGGYSYTMGDEGQLGATYEARTGMPEVIDTIKLKYGISTEIDGFLFAGDCSHTKIKNASNLIFRSRPGMYSIFDYINDFLTLKSKPTALANFNGRLYAFDEKNIYRINQQSLAIEDIYEGVGCTGKDSVVVTEYGMFFADRNGAYMHNGQSPIKISEPIQKGGDTENVFGGTDNIKNVSWNNTVTNSTNYAPYVAFDSDTGSVLFNIEYVDKLDTDTVGLTITKTKNYIWSFNITKKRWDLWELVDDVEVGKPFIGEKGEIYFPIGDAVFENRGGSSKRDYTWVSKKLTMNEDSIVKVFNKVKINGPTKDLNVGGTYIHSSDKLLVKTSSGDVATGNMTSSVDTAGFVDYKLSGSNKKGRWIQFKAENITEPIDSFGFIFRRKSTK